MKIGDRVVLIGDRPLVYETTVRKGHRGTVVCSPSRIMVFVWWDGMPETGYVVLFDHLRLMRPLELLAECAA